MANTESSSSNTDLFGDLLKAGLALLAGGVAVKKGSDALVDHNRREILDHLPLQNLSWLEEQKMRSFFRDRRFYVTQFPETPPANFPTAAKILYDLFCYLGSPYENKKLRYSLEQSLSDYVIHKPDGQTFLFTPTEIVFLLDRSYHRQRSLEYFLNEAGWGLLAEQDIKIPITDKEGKVEDGGKLSGLILVKLFGMISGKRRIDIALFKSKFLGRIEKYSELIEDNLYFSQFYPKIESNQFIIHIYDIIKQHLSNKKMEKIINDLFNLGTYSDFVDRFGKKGFKFTEAEKLLLNAQIDEIKQSLVHYPNIDFEYMERYLEQGQNMAYNLDDEPLPAIYFEIQLVVGIRDSIQYYLQNTTKPLRYCCPICGKSLSELGSADKMNYHHMWSQENPALSITQIEELSYLSPAKIVKILQTLVDLNDSPKKPFNYPWNLRMICENDHNKDKFNAIENELFNQIKK